MVIISERILKVPKNNDPTPRTFMDRLRESKFTRGVALLGAGATLATLTACGPSEKEAPAPAPTTASAPVTPGASETTTPTETPTTKPSPSETAGEMTVEQIEAKRNEVSKALDIDPAAFKKLPRAEQGTLVVNYVDWMYVKYNRNDDFANRLGDTVADGYKVLDTVSSVAADWGDTEEQIEYKRRLMQVALETSSNNNTLEYSEDISDNIKTFFKDNTIDGKIDPHFVFKGADANAVMRCTGVADRMLSKYDSKPWEHAWTAKTCTNAELPVTWIGKYTPTSDGRYIWDMVIQ